MWWIDDVVLSATTGGTYRILGFIKYLILLLVGGVEVVLEVG